MHACPNYSHDVQQMFFGCILKMSMSNAQCVYLTKSTLSETTLRGVLTCFLTFVMSEALHNVMQHVQKWELLKTVIT